MERRLGAQRGGGAFEHGERLGAEPLLALARGELLRGVTLRRPRGAGRVQVRRLREEQRRRPLVLGVQLVDALG